MQFTKNSLVFPRQNIIYLTETESTNSLAKEMASNSRPVSDGTVIMAAHQTAGRGQQGAVWSSAPGMNLTFSIITDSGFLDMSQQFLLGVSSALAIRTCLVSDFGFTNVQVKWPNDVYAGNSKIAGILVENLVQGNSLRHTISGIGLNVNQTKFLLEKGRATSMKIISTMDYSLEQVFNSLFDRFSENWERLKAGEFVQMRSEYLKVLVGLDELRNFKTASGTITGKITGIDQGGRLLLEQNGAVNAYWNKEIEFEFPS